MLIAQISDTHITERGRKSYRVAPMEDNLSEVINHINQVIPKPDLVLLTGDITCYGTVTETSNAARLLRALNCPYFIVPGNHDNRSNLWSEFSGTACPSRVGKFINYVVEGKDIRLIGLDTTIENASGGELCDTRLAWLDKCLSDAPRQPTIIFMHHPPVKCSVLETDVFGFIGVNRFAEIVGKYSSIERILCGHIHLPSHTRFQGTIVSTAPSIGMRLGLDLTMKKESEFFMEPPSYQLHHWTAQKNLITHTIHVNDAEGPCPFKD